MEAEVKTEGDYYLRASMAKADKSLTLDNESVPCTLTVCITREGKPRIKNEVTSLSRYAEYGFAEIQYYKGGGWHLAPGEYEIEISSRENCSAAMIRGATLSLERQTTHVTENFLVNVLRFYGGVLFLCAGLLGIIICEFKKPTMRGSQRSPRLAF